MLTDIGQYGLQIFCLLNIPRVAVKDKTICTVFFGESLSNNTENDVISDQISGIHRSLGALTKFSACCNCSAQQITCRNLRHTKISHQLLCLCALA